MNAASWGRLPGAPAKRMDAGGRSGLGCGMRPVDIQPIGEELAIKWDDGAESFVRLEKLRRCCPCAGCKGEMDILGNLYKGPDRPLSPRAFELLRVVNVGSDAIQPIWADQHATGIYSFDYLRRVAEAE